MNDPNPWNLLVGFFLYKYEPHPWNHMPLLTWLFLGLGFNSWGGSTCWDHFFIRKLTTRNPTKLVTTGSNLLSVFRKQSTRNIFGWRCTHFIGFLVVCFPYENDPYPWTLAESQPNQKKKDQVEDSGQNATSNQNILRALTGLSTNRDCGSKGVKADRHPFWDPEIFFYQFHFSA